MLPRAGRRSGRPHKRVGPENYFRFLAFFVFVFLPADLLPADLPARIKKNFGSPTINHVLIEPDDFKLYSSHDCRL
jgi:hypothetical protein